MKEKKVKVVTLKPSKKGKEVTRNGQKVIRYGMTKRVESSEVQRFDSDTGLNYLKDSICRFCPYFKQRRKKDPDVPPIGWLRGETYCAMGNEPTSCFRSSGAHHELKKARAWEHVLRQIINDAKPEKKEYI